LSTNPPSDDKSIARYRKYLAAAVALNSGTFVVEAVAKLLSAEVKSSEGGIERINPVFIRMLAHPTY
jgi:hypothetical protein